MPCRRATSCSHTNRLRAVFLCTKRFELLKFFTYTMGPIGEADVANAACVQSRDVSEKSFKRLYHKRLKLLFQE